MNAERTGHGEPHVWGSFLLALLMGNLLLAVPQHLPAQSRGESLEVPRIVLPDEDRSWEDDPAAENARDLFFIGRDLWSAASNELVTPDAYGGTSSGGGAGWLVSGAPDLIVYMERGGATAGFMSYAPSVTPVGGRPGSTLTMPVVVPPHPNPRPRQIQPSTGFPGPFLGQDLRRVLYFQAGDLWRAELDWSQREFVNHQPVTHVGVLTSPRRTDIVPLVWHANTLLVRTPFSQEHPILRIDLGSGEIQEMGDLMVFQDGMFTNPSGSRACNSHGDVWVCYEMVRGETFRLALPSRVRARFPGRQPVGDADPTGRRPARSVWVDDETLLFVEEAPDVALASGQPRPHDVVRVDFRSRRSDVLFQADGPATLELLPGGRHVAVWISLDRTDIRGVRVGIQDGSTSPLPSELPLQGQWIDENRYVYSRETGALHEIGTWLYDTATGDARRVCQFPAESDFQRTRLRTALFFPEHDVVYFRSPAQGGGVFRSRVGAGECELVSAGPPGSHTIFPLLTPPLDLRLTESGDALWKP